MSERPLVLGLHAVVELAALVAIGFWAWSATDGVQRWVFALALPVLVGTVWAVFRVPGDGGEPLIVVPGRLRLVIELGVMGLAVALLWAAGQGAWAIGLLALVVLDYALQYDRVARLLS